MTDPDPLPTVTNPDVPVGGYARYAYPDGCSKCRFPYIEGVYHKCMHDIPRRYWPRCERCGDPMAPMQYHDCRRTLGLYPTEEA